MTDATDKAQRTVVLDGQRLKNEREALGLTISQGPDFIAEKVKGYNGGVSESTYRRAESGKAVFVKTARVIAQAFGVPFEVLVVNRYRPPPLADADHFLPEVMIVLRRWLVEGQLFPTLPEFLLRLKGEWEGWNHYRRVTPDTPEWIENEIRDIYEDCAFSIATALVTLDLIKQVNEPVPPSSAGEARSQAPPAPQPGRPSYTKDDLARIDGDQVKKLRKERGWTQARLAEEMGSAGVGWLRKIEARKMVRLEWSSNNAKVVKAGEDLAAALEVDLNTLILDLLDGEQIKQFRAQRNWGLEEFAEHAHVGIEVVGRADTGQPVRRVETRALADALNVPLVDLLFKEQAS